MRRFKEFIMVNENIKSLEERWWDAIRREDIEELKYLLFNGIDINIVNKFDLTALVITDSLIVFKFLLKQPGININFQNDVGITALIANADGNLKQFVRILLEQPNIDVTLEDMDGNFIDNIINKMDEDDEYSTSFLIDYKLQKKIIKNGREDILIFFNKYQLVHPKIKEENPDLFKAKEWGLI